MTSTTLPCHQRLGVALLLLLLLPGMAAAQTTLDVDAEPDLPSTFKEPAPWSESELKLPDWPRDQDLIEIATDQPNPRFRFFIDSRSLRTGDDDVVRFTLIAESQSGVRNIDYRGLRCRAQGLYRIYAYGIDGNFKPTGLPDTWISIRDPIAEPVQQDLWRYYLCNTQVFKPLKRRQQLQFLRRGGGNGTQDGMTLD